MIRVTGLFLYPVKSLRGFAVPAADVDALGFVGDRRFLVVDPTGKFITQRAAPRMARIDTRLADGALTLAADGAGTVTVPTASDPSAPLRTVSVWRSEGLLAEDCGDTAAAWLGDFLGIDCRLVRAGARYRRPVLKSAARPGDVVSFADAVPILVVGEASLADLNDRLTERGEEPVPMDRFRPNIVVAGAPPFAEDAWPRLAIRSGSAGDAAPARGATPTGDAAPVGNATPVGDSAPVGDAASVGDAAPSPRSVASRLDTAPLGSPRSPRAEGGAAPLSGTVFRSAGPSARCIMTTTDQRTGERLGPEPLRTLATYRRAASAPTDVNFGVNLLPDPPFGTIRVGDAVEPLP